MDDLISRKALEAEIFDALKDGGDIDGAFILNTLDAQETVDAVPLDKLCEWLERYATMDCDGCRESFGSCEDEENQEVSVCNSRERWKAMLSKWMEGLDGEIY